jgi:hypothetical protein
LDGVDLELFGLFARFEADAPARPEQAERAIVEDPKAIAVFARATGYVEFPNACHRVSSGRHD